MEGGADGGTDGGRERRVKLAPPPLLFTDPCLGIYFKQVAGSITNPSYIHSILIWSLSLSLYLYERQTHYCSAAAPEYSWRASTDTDQQVVCT